MLPHLKSGESDVQISGNLAQFTYISLVTHKAGAAVTSQQKFHYHFTGF